MAAIKPAKTGEAAPDTPYGKALNSLIEKAGIEGQQTLYAITKPALTRLLNAGLSLALSTQHIYNSQELAKLTKSTASVVSTGNLLGHSDVRQKQEKIEQSGPNGTDVFADIEPPIFTYDPAALPILQPFDAIEYFKNLVPRMGVDPIHWMPLMNRTAFTLAAATEQTVVEKVQKILLDRLRSGDDIGTGPSEIEQILNEVGVTPRNPQYAEMVQRTNLMDAYTTGYQIEMEHPEVKEFFPAWKYLGIKDGRQGKDHEIRFGNYYPNSLAFALVRGPRVFNCRCCPNAIDKYKWKDLVNSGAVLSTL